MKVPCTVFGPCSVLLRDPSKEDFMTGPLQDQLQILRILSFYYPLWWFKIDFNSKSDIHKHYRGQNLRERNLGLFKIEIIICKDSITWDALGFNTFSEKLNQTSPLRKDYWFEFPFPWRELKSLYKHITPYVNTNTLMLTCTDIFWLLLLTGQWMRKNNQFL